MNKSPICCTFCKKSRDESLKMVVSGDSAICDNCIVLFNGLLSSPAAAMTSNSVSSISSIDIPLEKKQFLNSIKIREFVDQYVVGQETAKMALSVSIVNHYKRIFGDKELNKSNLLIVGPSGSGKSLLVSTIAKFLNVPFISVDATTLTEAGYIGQNVDTIISRLLVEAKGNITAAETGIVFLDEIDKITANKGRTTGVENRVAGIQYALLKMIEGVKVSVTPENKRSSKMVEVDTSNILFIGSGAFIGLNDIAAIRLKKKKGLGFSDNIQHNLSDLEYTSDDFIEFGMIPEFIGRFPLRTCTKELTEEELLQVLHISKNNILNEYKFYFDVDGINLDFSQEFLKKLVSQIKSEKTGVRGLRAICDSLLLPHLYLIPEYQKRNVAKITFTESCIDKKQIPKIEIFEKKRQNNA